jgi:hypothetical protein
MRKILTPLLNETRLHLPDNGGGDKNKNIMKTEEWISVKDRLPEKMGLYLIYKKPDPDRRVEYLIDVRWYHPEAPFSEYTTHWMPLPEAPKILIG